MPIRILMIAPQAPILGGQGIQAEKLLARMAAESELDVTFLPMNPRLRGPLRLLHEIKLVKTALMIVLYVAKLLAAVSRHDLIHVFAAGNFSFLFAPAPAILIGRLFGKPVLVHYHDGRAEGHLSRWPGARWLLSRAGAIVVPSEYLAEIFARFGLETEVVKNVVEGDAFDYRERERPRPIFHHNRAFEAHYNVPCTLRAFGIVQQRYPDARLILTHDGPLRGKLERLVRELDLRNVEFRGKVSQEQTPAILDSVDVYLTSSNVDCMPVSILECFAAGLPFAATAAGGTTHMVDDDRTGLLVPLDDHEALAAAALRLIEEPGLAARLARAGRAELANYDWDASLREQWIAAYGELAGR